MADSNSSDSNATPNSLADFFGFPSGTDSNETDEESLKDFFDFEGVERRAKEKARKEKELQERIRQATLAFPAEYRENRKTLSPELHKQLLYQEWVAARDEAIEKSKKKGK